MIAHKYRCFMTYRFIFLFLRHWNFKYIVQVINLQSNDLQFVVEWCLISRSLISETAISCGQHAYFRSWRRASTSWSTKLVIETTFKLTIDIKRTKGVVGIGRVAGQKLLFNDKAAINTWSFNWYGVIVCKRY